MFHWQLILLREIFQKISYPENFIDRCFNLSLNRIHILQEKVSTVEKKPMQLVLPYLRTVSLQPGLNCKRSSNEYLTVVNYRLFSEVEISCYNFRYKYPISQILISGVVYQV